MLKTKNASQVKSEKAFPSCSIYNVSPSNPHLLPGDSNINPETTIPPPHAKPPSVPNFLLPGFLITHPLYPWRHRRRKALTTHLAASQQTHGARDAARVVRKQSARVHHPVRRSATHEHRAQHRLQRDLRGIGLLQAMDTGILPARRVRLWGSASSPTPPAPCSGGTKLGWRLGGCLHSAGLRLRWVQRPVCR